MEIVVKNSWAVSCSIDGFIRAFIFDAGEDFGTTDLPGNVAL